MLKNTKQTFTSFTTKKPSGTVASDSAESHGLENDLIIRAARGLPTERPAVWVMRQAGRYLPEFRKIRETHDFFDCCRDPKLACEITLQPIRRYQGLLDAAIIFSDILVIPQAMGLEVVMHPLKGPSFPKPLNEPTDLTRLNKKIDVEKELGYVFEAIKLTRKQLEGTIPLIGFCGAPWTLMAYMIEGGGSKGFEKAKNWLYKYPEQSKELLQKITDVCCDFLVGQVKAGAQLLQVFDSWAGELSPQLFRTFSLPYLKQISSSVRDSLSCSSHPCVPLIIFAKGVGHSLPDLAKSGYDVLALDHTIEPSMARNVVEKVAQGSVSYSKSSGENELTHKLALQGNLDPTVLLSDKEAIEREVERMLKSKKGGFGGSGAYIAGLGGGVSFNTDPENLKTFLKAVHRIGREVATAHDEE